MVQIKAKEIDNMNKKIPALLLTGAMLLTMTSCQEKGNRRHHRDDDAKETTEETTEETTAETSADVTSQTIVVSDITGGTWTPPYDSDFVPEDDYGYLMPYTESSTSWPNQEIWENKHIFQMGFVDQDGNPVGEAIFNTISALEGTNFYLVGQLDENMKWHYGLMTLDGSIYTGLIYDGYYQVPDNSVSEAGYVYMSRYDDGILRVDEFDFEMNTVIEDRAIILDTDQLQGYSSSCLLCVEKVYDDERAVVMLWQDEIGPVGDYLIDTTTGEVLATFTEWIRPIFTNTMIISRETMGDIVICDLDGNDITADCVAAYALSEDRVVIFTNDTVGVLDNDGNVICSMEMGDHYDQYVSSGRILIGTNNGVEVYDQDLNLITVGDVSLNYGLTVNDSTHFTNDEVVFVDWSGERIIDLESGTLAIYNDEYDYRRYSGFIVGSDQFDSEFTVFDADLNSVLEGEGAATVVEDMVTEDIYLVVVATDPATLEGSTNVYRITSGEAELMYETEGEVNGYSVTFIEGTMDASIVGTTIIVSPEGEVIFSCDIADQ